ncbi:MAG: hypothetical protein E6G50_12815 [Actinobacteria bacterium]|nr:MAG: hypothetical protein E6G50_12815 [Actinomycetota bacterium]
MFVADASTVLPLFCVVVPLPPQGEHELPLASATFGPLTTTGSDVADWLALFEPSFDCVAVCDVPG